MERAHSGQLISRLSHQKNKCSDEDLIQCNRARERAAATHQNGSQVEDVVTKL